MNIGEFFVTLGVKADVATLKDFGKSLANLPVDAAAAIAALAGVSFEFSHMADEAIKTATAFQLFGNETGLSWQQLQKWQLVAEQANVSAETVSSSITQLQRNMADIRLGRGNIAPFQMLGINPNQDAFAVLDQLRNKIRGINPATATNIVNQMGISPEMMNVLRLSDQQFGAFFNHIHGLTNRQEQDFLSAKLALTQWGETFRFAAFGVISDFTEAIAKASEFKAVLIGVAAVLGIAAIATFPLTAAMVALLLVLDDLAVYFVGGKSLTGNAVEGLKELGVNLGTIFKQAIPGVAAFERWLVVLQNMEKIFERLHGFAIADTVIAALTGGPATAIGAALGELTGNKNTNNQATVNFNVATAGSLDAPGWQTVAGYVKRAVEDAHLQLNN